MPTVRVDTEVMDALKTRAVEEGLVFRTPNDVLRSVLALEVKTEDNHAESPMPQQFVDIELGNMRGREEYHLIPIKKRTRRFFPGYKLEFERQTDLGSVNTHVTSAAKGTRNGDPDQGTYIQKGLRDWFRGHPELQDGAVVRIESVQEHSVYKLLVIHSGDK